MHKELKYVLGVCRKASEMMENEDISSDEGLSRRKKKLCVEEQGSDDDVTMEEAAPKDKPKPPKSTRHACQLSVVSDKAN